MDGLLRKRNKIKKLNNGRRPTFDKKYSISTRFQGVVTISVGSTGLRNLCNIIISVVINAVMTLVITCWSASRTICLFVFSVFSFCSYWCRRSGATAIRLNRMSWYGSLEVIQRNVCHKYGYFITMVLSI